MPKIELDYIRIAVRCPGGEVHSPTEMGALLNNEKFHFSSPCKVLSGDQKTFQLWLNQQMLANAYGWPAI